MNLKKIKNSIISFVADIRVYKGGIVLFGDSSYKIKGKHMRELLEILEPGDVLLRRYDNYLGTLFIPGYFSHAAIYVWDECVIHMLGKGITIEDILTFMRTDDICVLRPKMHIDEKNKIIKLAYKTLEEKKQYDYDFKSSDTRELYCTEFINYIFNYPIPKEKIILPDDFLKCKLFEKKWVKTK